MAFKEFSYWIKTFLTYLKIVLYVKSSRTTCHRKHTLNWPKMMDWHLILKLFHEWVFIHIRLRVVFLNDWYIEGWRNISGSSGSATLQICIEPPTYVLPYMHACIFVKLCSAYTLVMIKVHAQRCWPSRSVSHLVRLVYFICIWLICLKSYEMRNRICRFT